MLEAAVVFTPLAVYFMILGLLNSQAGPRLLDARDDFLLLAAAVSPLVLVPIGAFARAGQAWLVLPLVIAVVLAVRLAVPRRSSGWVIYNLSVARARVMMERIVRELGWSHRAEGDCLAVPDRGLTLRFSALPGLRTVTVHLDAADARSASEATAQLRERLGRVLQRQESLPSAAGCALMLIGVAMLMVPLWMMSRHSQAIAELVTRLLM